MAQVGQSAPDFTLKNTSHEVVTLSEQQGKTVVLAFFPAAFTGVCEKELCTFRDAMSAFNDMNALVLGISVDSPFANAGFKQKTELNFELLSDYTRSTVTAYGIALPNFAGLQGYTASERAVFIVDAGGTIAYRWVGENPGVEPNYDEVAAEVAKL